jgi:alkylation response protein AidB-like acyl-CoA dehydrogenase
MLKYAAPLGDMQFVIKHWLDAPAQWRFMKGCEELDLVIVDSILDEAARFATDRLVPLNLPGDIEGCRFHDGAVSTPAGYRDAYQSFVHAGWPALSCSTEDGGQGLPLLLNAALYEMLNAGAQAWAMYPGLAHGAYECLRAHGSAYLRKTYVPKLVSGEWLATMCLTESHAGSDLGLLRTKADLEPGVDGQYRITGRKIFISGGAHDLTDNIIHLVLARVSGAPAGSKGLSLFLVPQKFTDDAGVHVNTVRCEGIEHKMGIKGSATCTLLFEEAKGWIIGKPNRGLAAMFVMMNAARLLVALQGLGQAELALQNAAAYASDRRQMRAVGRETGTLEHADPIAAHPAIQRILNRLRAVVEGERALGFWIAHLLDLAERHEDEVHRQRCLGLASLLTPIAKSLFTENGFLLSSQALQVFGGHGYIRDMGIEQVVRDSRIAMVYEGTNEIQAIDLVQRKVLADDGAVLGQLLSLIEEEIAACARGASYVSHALFLKRSIDRLRGLTQGIAHASSTDRELPLRLADDYLKALGMILLGYVWCKTLRLALKLETTDSSGFYESKLATGLFFFSYALPGLDVHLQFIATTLDAARIADGAIG